MKRDRQEERWRIIFLVGIGFFVSFPSLIWFDDVRTFAVTTIPLRLLVTLVLFDLGSIWYLLNRRYPRLLERLVGRSFGPFYPPHPVVFSPLMGALLCVILGLVHLVLWGGIIAVMRPSALLLLMGVLLLLTAFGVGWWTVETWGSHLLRQKVFGVIHLLTVIMVILFSWLLRASIFGAVTVTALVCLCLLFRRFVFPNVFLFR